jgi:prophage regulatory protein
MSETHLKLLRLPEVKIRSGLSRSTLYNKIKNNEFPAPVNLGGRAVAWVDAEIQSWIEARIQSARGGAK